MSKIDTDQVEGIGDLTTLTTSNKNSLVEAVNEVKGNMPTSSDYITTNTNQTGLSGDKTTSGSWTFSGAVNPLSGWVNGQVSSYRPHSIRLGGSGRDYMDFFEVGALWNFYRSQPTGNTLVASISGNKISSNGYEIYGRTNADIVLAGGGHRPVSDFALVSSLNSYLPLSSNKLGSASNIQVDLDTETNSIGWATSNILNRPFKTNSTVLSMRGATGYGGQIATRNGTFWLRGIENNVWGNWETVATREWVAGSIGNYLRLDGTSNMTGTINSTNSNILSWNGDVRLHLNTNNTLIGGSNNALGGIYLRPQGTASVTNQVVINNAGTITTTNHGDSSQWNQAYAWVSLGGVSRTSVLLNSSNNLNLVIEPGYYHHIGGSPPLNIPISGTAGYLEVVNNTPTFIRQTWRGRDVIYEYQRTRDSGGVWSEWVEYITTDNLDSQAISLGFIKSSSIPTYTASNGIDLVSNDFRLSSSSLASLALANTAVQPSALSGYVPTSRTLTAGNGLSGGGNLTANRTITLGTPSAITLSSTNSVTTSSHTHAFTPGGTIAQYIRGDGSLATMPANTDTVTRLRGTTSGTYTSGDLTLVAGANTTITQSGATITIASTNTNTTYTAGTGLSLTGTTFANTAPNATHTGDVTGATALTIANSAVTHAKYQNIATQRILGRGAAGTGNVQELTLGANLSLSTAGVLSATNTNTTYSAGTGLTLSGTTFGQTITTSGTGTFVSSITQTANGFQVNLSTPSGGSSGIEAIRTDNSAFSGPAKDPDLYFNFHEYWGFPQAFAEETQPGNATAKATADKLDFFASYDSVQTMIEYGGTADVDMKGCHIVNVLLQSPGGDVYLPDGVYAGDQVNITTIPNYQINIYANNLITTTGNEVRTFANLVWDCELEGWVMTAFGAL